MKKPQVQGVWVDVYELSRYRGTRRRLFGPSQLTAVRSRAREWGIGIDSLVLGPKAYVRFFQAGETNGQCIWLFPEQGIPDVVELQVEDAIDSISILDRPPRRGEPGYTAFVAARRLQRSDKD
jgi:hypothetical protein